MKLNRYDVGAKEDYDNMTREMGRECLIFLRDDLLSSDGRVIENNKTLGTPEIVSLIEMNSTNELIDSGLLSVGSVKFQFMSTSIVENEALVTDDNGITFYKVIKLTKSKNMANNLTMTIKGYGYKLPNR